MLSPTARLKSARCGRLKSVCYKARVAALLGVLAAVTWSGVRQSLVYRLMQVTNSDQVLGNSTLQNTGYRSEMNAFSPVRLWRNLLADMVDVLLRVGEDVAWLL